MMGSQYFVDHPSVPLDSIDMMVCMDLVGHAVGPEAMPAEIRNTVFALGAERSAGTAAHVDRLARAVPGVVVRRIDAEAIPPLSDYHAFWERSIPFLFLSNGRSRVYHTPEDTVRSSTSEDAGDRGVARALRARDLRPPGGAHRVARGIRDDASTLRTLADVARALEAGMPSAGRRARGRRGAARGVRARRPDSGPAPRRGGPAHRGAGGRPGLACLVGTTFH